MEFKDKVYQARMQLNLTQMEFAKELGFDSLQLVGGKME